MWTTNDMPSRPKGIKNHNSFHNLERPNIEAIIKNELREKKRSGSGTSANKQPDGARTHSKQDRCEGPSIMQPQMLNNNPSAGSNLQNPKVNLKQRQFLEIPSTLNISESNQEERKEDNSMMSQDLLGVSFGQRDTLLSKNYRLSINETQSPTKLNPIPESESWLNDKPSVLRRSFDIEDSDATQKARPSSFFGLCFNFYVKLASNELEFSDISREMLSFSWVLFVLILSTLQVTGATLFFREDETRVGIMWALQVFLFVVIMFLKTKAHDLPEKEAEGFEIAQFILCSFVYSFIQVDFGIPERSEFQFFIYSSLFVYLMIMTQGIRCINHCLFGSKVAVILSLLDVLLMFITLFCVIFHQVDHLVSTSEFVLFGFQILGTSALIYTGQSLQFKLQKLVIEENEKGKGLKEELRTIMDNLEGSILILDDKTKGIYYHNAQFTNLTDAYTNTNKSVGLLDGSILSKKIFMSVDLKSLRRQATDSEYERTQLQVYSLEDLLTHDSIRVCSRMFKLVMDSPKVFRNWQVSQASDAGEGSARFVQLIITKFEYKGFPKRMIQIVDISKSLLYEQASAKNEFLSLINATVSHEIKNPLNSILNQNLNLETIVGDISSLIQSIMQEVEESSKRSKNRIRQKQWFTSSIEQGNSEMQPYHESRAELLRWQEQIAEQLQPILSNCQVCQSILRSSTKQLTHQISCMMDYASITSHRFKKNSTIFDVKEAISEMMDILHFQSTSLQNEVEVIFNNFEGANYFVKTDKERLQQVFYNVYSNAHKFTFKGTITVAVTKVVPAKEGATGRIEISVKDTGQGVCKEDQPKLFQLFGIIKDTNSNSTGIGLGLFLSKLIVKKFEGDINVISDRGQGSEFYFSFALEEENEALFLQRQKILQKIDKVFMSPQRQTTRSPSAMRRHKLSQELFFKFKPNIIEERNRGKSQFQKLRNINRQSYFSDESSSEDEIAIRKSKKPLEASLFPQILVVDDQVFNLEAVKVILRVSNIDLEKQVITAFNGQQAVERVKERGPNNQFDLIFMDCNMPFKDGPTATKEIREMIDLKVQEQSIGEFQDPLLEWRQPKIVAITGHVEDNFITKALKSGMDSVICKPATPSDLQGVLFELLQQFLKSRLRKVRTSTLQADEMKQVLLKSSSFVMSHQNYPEINISHISDHEGASSVKRSNLATSHRPAEVTMNEITPRSKKNKYNSFHAHTPRSLSKFEKEEASHFSSQYQSHKTGALIPDEPCPLSASSDYEDTFNNTPMSVLSNEEGAIQTFEARTREQTKMGNELPKNQAPPSSSDFSNPRQPAVPFMPYGF